ncbi:Ubiquinone/menaquinone biosynthesis C-methyltransferase UbiE [Gimesia alba]|uniref:Ubiquinone/menaquinone biosynthesis C-methyltransferase UbiE n=1 Tax=Gimesia alba TaxID=2527973 RepID=A0A517RFJ8_9PLAN|nr:class I SAM-dependent methyltransferase [Gimesia alba]QDT42630.1 Ubiquinone/menaquinone biosynthesis C-methyltransferase UbiE [Gimesia alba]
MSNLSVRLSEFKTLWHLLVSRIDGQTHAERLNSFYGGQAAGYDQFRKRLLHGRCELFESLPVAKDGVWVDLGAGTGENAELWGERLAQFQRAYLVDLCQPLLDVCEQRIADRGWGNVKAVCDDATRFAPPESEVDLVTFSYSLTMIPDWFQAVNHAWDLLRPGGMLGIVDFYVSRKYPQVNRKSHSWFQRHFWPTWFAGDNVFLNPDHLPYLLDRFEMISLKENQGSLPYVPFCKVPYYILIAQKPG